MDSILKYRFTAYLQKSIQRHKAKYLQRKRLVEIMEITMEYPESFTKGVHFDFDSIFPFEMNNYQLQLAINELSERDFNILYMHVVEKYTLKEISEDLNLNYVTTRQAYTRSLKKIRIFLEAGDDNDR